VSVQQRGSYVTDRAATDGIARLISYEKLEDYPVTVLVTQALNEVLVPYFRQREVVVGIGALLTTLTLAFAALLHRSMRRTQLVHDQLHRLATTDSLTGVSNRRTFLENAQREFSRAARFARPLAVLMLDIDHFKQVNDVSGHAAGDVVLRDCARAWQASLREQDLIGRTGGEEFCAVLPETTLEEAVQIAERLRAATSVLRFPGKEGDFSVTVSIGATCVGASDEQFSQAVGRADRALYLAKQHGRNRVESLQEMQIVQTGSVS
jgi:diguanylate cyclase (GGDEF)-like protein